MTQTHRIWSLAQQIVDKAGADGILIAAAESCTGGMVSGAITDVPGASAILDRGFVTYSNEAKTEMLGVCPSLITQKGAVSQAVAKSMASGCIRHSDADIAVAITGIAGPSGGSDKKPVGLVWFGLATRKGIIRTERRIFASGDRNFVRMKATETALSLILSAFRD
jgi:nicotinamide-nucleotide amidase